MGIRIYLQTNERAARRLARSRVEAVPRVGELISIRDREETVYRVCEVHHIIPDTLTMKIDPCVILHRIVVSVEPLPSDGNPPSQDSPLTTTRQ